MESAVRVAKGISAVIGAMLAVGALMGAANSALIEHLDRTFATREEIQAIQHSVDRIEHKVDSLAHKKR